MTEYKFYRAGRCRGENGQVYFDYNQQRSSDGTTTPTSHISIDYTADHEIASYQVGTLGDTLVIQNFRPYANGDQDLITLDIYNQDSLDIRAAVAFGCTSSSSLLNTVQQLRASSDLGFATATKVERYEKPVDVVTNQLVTREIWGFRALNNAQELSRLLNQSSLSSKAQLFLTDPSKTRPNVQEFWDRSGPRVFDVNSNTALAMRLLATSDSAQPRSQFL